MARWKNINGVLQKIAGSVRIDQVLNKLSRNAISNKAVSEKFEEVDLSLETAADDIDEINTHLNGLLAWTDSFIAQNGVVTVNYPTGFNQSNSAVISVIVYTGQDRVDTRYSYLVDLMPNNISFNAFNWDIQFTVKILLIKVN